MKKLLVCCLALLCSTTLWAQKDRDKERNEDDLIYRLDHKVLEGYTVKPTVSLSKDISYWLITDEEQFDDMFQSAGEMGVTVKRPDFKTQYVFAIASPETRYQTYLAFKRVEVVNEKDVKVHCIKMEDYKQNFKYVPVLVGTVPKTPFVKHIVFCDEDEKEQKRYSLDKIDKEKQKIAEQQIKAEKEAAEKAEKEAKSAAEKAEKEKKITAAAKAREEKERAEEEAYMAKEKAKEEQKAKEKAERQKQKDQELKDRQEREAKELKAQEEHEEREARLEEARLKKERAEAKLQAEEEAKERAEIEKEKEEMRKEREERKAKRKAERQKAQEEEE